MDPESELTFRLIDPLQLQELLEATRSQETYFTEAIVDHVVIHYERKRIIPRPLSAVDREYLSGRMRYCAYSPTRVDFGPIAFFIRELFRDEKAEVLPLGNLLIGGVESPFPDEYGKVDLFRAPEIANNVERLREAIDKLDNAFNARQFALQTLALRRFQRESIDLSELKQSVHFQLERLMKFFLRALEREKMILAYMH